MTDAPPHDHNAPAELRRTVGGRSYAITFDLDTEAVNEHAPHAYSIIKKFLESHGFYNQQGSVYFGTEGLNALDCVLAVQQFQSEHPWFRLVVNDIRMLRIEDNNDLRPALEVPMQW